VVSMGDVAASGGYYISAYADSLFANATTITGSIGVFGTLPNAQELLEEKIGVTFDNVKTASHADLMTIADPLDDFEYAAIQKSVVEVYDNFVNIVAEGRDMSYEQVDNIGQGRVWSGEDALRIGLVDKLGNLEDAIACAARLASMGEYRTKELPKPVDPFEELIKELGGNKTMSPEAILGDDFPELVKLYKQMRSAQRVQGIQARLPFMLEVN